VLLVTPRWARDGGVGAHIEASAAALAAAGMQVSILAARVESSEPLAGVSVYRSSALFDTSAPMHARVGEALAAQPEMIHLNQLDDPQVVAYMRRSAPVAISAHGYLGCTSGVHYFRPGQECQRQHGAGCIPNLLARGCAHTRDPRSLPAAYRQATRAVQALRGADLAISYSSAMDRHLDVNGVQRRRVIPYFPTLEAKQGCGHAERRRVLFAGRIVTPKGVATLVRAAREVDAEFVVCGDGWQLPAMRKLARRLGVEQRVRFTGWLDADALAQQFADASVVAVPSLWPEPFGIVGIEAFAAGRPVVASTTGGIGDWLTDGVSGLGVAPGDARALARALNELLADPERQRSMGAAGHSTLMAKFTAERHVAAIQDAYRAARLTWEASAGGDALAVAALA
jgi:glycosyltransferase involved in cell wall biosynthesis